jgi:chloramphenicol 3-O-phosphotransferase
VSASVGRTGRSEPAFRATDPRRVVVVGPCASGKTTLARGLQQLGYQATVCGQEHSDIPTLWRRREPDVLIGLMVDLETIRRRRGRSWPETIYERQRRRLAEAMARADIVLDATRLDPSEVLAAAVHALQAARRS